MASNLPQTFISKMEEMLDGEFDRFMSSYNDPRVYGLRINRLKLDREHWREISPIGSNVRSIPWAEDGFYYNDGERPGKHPHYHAGLYYIQEPSAMAPVELLDVQPGHRVLDLCAAPGGKSTQIAGKLNGQGVLVSNDNAKERTKALAKNIELAGVRNAVVLNEEPSRLAPVFPNWFDRILVDAPCSGEGMFRKDESMIAEWEKNGIERYCDLQRHILRDAAMMLAPGGMLVYSTCTFSPEENETQIANFLADHPDFIVLQVEHLHGWTAGRPDWSGESGLTLETDRLQSIAGTVRLWPQHIEGEGHYAAVLQRKDVSVDSGLIDAPPAIERNLDDERALNNYEPEDTQQRKKGSNGKTLHAGEKRNSRSGKDNSRPQGRGSERLVGRSSHVETVDPIMSWHEFAAAQLSDTFKGEGKLVTFGSRIYLQPVAIPALDGLRVVRAGWYLGEAGRNKFEPSQALAVGLFHAEARRTLSWQSEDPNTIRYLKGETLFVDHPDIRVHGDVEDHNRSEDVRKGYVLVCTDGYPIGWGKYTVGGMLKNELSTGWRFI